MTIILISILVSLVNPLDEYKWQNRIVLLFSNDKELLNEQVGLLETNQVGLTNRDIKIFTIYDGGSNNNNWSNSDIIWLKKKFNAQNDPFRFILIGKDGLEKEQFTDIINSDVLFSIIDKMPMRRVEMKNDIREKGN